MNFENPPVPSKEQEKKHEAKNHIPSLEEIRIKLTELIGHDHFQEFIVNGSAEPEACPTQYEVVVVEPNGDESLYTYQFTDTAQIFVAYYRGKITGENISDGETLAKRDSVTGDWNILGKNPQREQLEPFTPPQNIIATDSVRIAQETNEHNYRQLLEQFTIAEAVFGTTSLEETIEREKENMPMALEIRQQARPLLTEIYKELARLNAGDNSLTTWHASGQLTEEQFHELNARRKHLANLLGAINSGKIRHDLNP
jgi:hypothetical protein